MNDPSCFVDHRFHTTERLENETVFLHSWFDATLILVDQGNIPELNWVGFATPFESGVWLAIVVTVMLSSLVMVLIEALEHRRDGRRLHVWFSDHLYQSTLAFSQQFVFKHPNSGAGRVFLSSFAFWTMLVGATYTANLASLMVENALASPVTSVEGAMAAKLSICIHDGSASQTIMNSLYPALKEYPKLEKTATTKEMYERLATGRCDILIGTRQEFDIFRIQEDYGCKLVQAGGELYLGSASFAIEFDPLNCDSVLAYVLNIHLNEMSVDGNMTKFWNGYLNSRGSTCEGVVKDTSRRQLTGDGPGDPTISVEDSGLETGSFSQYRHLSETATRVSAGIRSDASRESNEESLNIMSMAGVFLVHGVGTCVAIFLALYSHFSRRNIVTTGATKHLGTKTVLSNCNLVDEISDLKAQMAKMAAQMELLTSEIRSSNQQSLSQQEDDMVHNSMATTTVSRKPITVPQSSKRLKADDSAGGKFRSSVSIWSVDANSEQIVVT